MNELAGHLRLRAAARTAGRTTLTDQSFRAPFHISKPYWDADTRTLVVQVVNPTAGILGGDRLESDIASEEGASLLVTTPSASRLFTMRETGAECWQRFSVAAGGWLEVMPEPLVPHRGSRFVQQTLIDVANGGSLFFVDQLLPGRIGFGETWGWALLNLTTSVRMDGVLAMRERFTHSGLTLCAMAHAFRSGPTACFANAIFIPPAASSSEAWLAAVNELHGGQVWCGVTALRTAGYSIKIVAPDPLSLRQTIHAVRERLAVVAPALGCALRKL